MDETPALPRRTHPKFIWGGAVIFLALVGMVGWAMGRTGSTAYFLRTTELAAAGPTTGGEEVRVNGNVVPGTIERDGLISSFEITDGSTALTITTDRPLPDSFQDSELTEIVALGSFDGHDFEASEVLAKCPSKFKPAA